MAGGDACLTKALAKDGYAITQHMIVIAGDYLVTVEHVNERAERAVAHLWVHAGE